MAITSQDYTQTSVHDNIGRENAQTVLKQMQSHTLKVVKRTR